MHACLYFSELVYSEILWSFRCTVTYVHVCIYKCVYVACVSMCMCISRHKSRKFSKLAVTWQFNRYISVYLHIKPQFKSDPLIFGRSFRTCTDCKRWCFVDDPQSLKELKLPPKKLRVSPTQRRLVGFQVPALTIKKSDSISQLVDTYVSQ